ncbi:MAG: FHA domain-containing protein [Myxococcales bacterium]|nr:FHA domain-containing protein [Myxococcales bacterium]
MTLELVQIGGSLRVPVMGFLVIGRGSGSAVHLDHPAVASVHATLQLDPNQGLTITDCGSETGTIVNGVRATDGPVHLRTGDELRIGPFVFRVAGGAEEPASVPMEGPRIATLFGAQLAPARPAILTSSPPRAPSLTPQRQRTPVALLEPEREVGAQVSASGTFLDGVQLGDIGLMLLVGRSLDLTRTRDVMKIERKITRDVARENGSPSALLSALNKALARYSLTATVTCLRLDHASRWLSYGMAGEAPPFVVRDGRASRLPAGPATVELGRIALAGFSEQHVELGHGELALAASRELDGVLAQPLVDPGGEGEADAAVILKRSLEAARTAANLRATAAVMVGG